MDGRLIAIAIAAVVAGAGVLTVFLVLKPVYVESDYDLLDTLKTDGVEEGLHYEYSEDVGDDWHALIIEVTDVEEENGVISADRTEKFEYENHVMAEGMDLATFEYLFMTLEQIEDEPFGLTVIIDVISPTEKMYNLDGECSAMEGTYPVYTKDLMLEFENVIMVIEELSEDHFEMKSIVGSITVNGERLTLYSMETITCKGMVYTFEGGDDPLSTVYSGSENRQRHTAFLNVNSLMSEFRIAQISSDVIVTTDEVMVHGTVCQKRLVNGNDTYYGNVYDMYTVVVHNNYVIDADGTLNGSMVHFHMDIYYV